MRDLFSNPELIEDFFCRLPDGVVILDERHVITYINDAFVKMVEFNRDELIGLAPPFPYLPKKETSGFSSAFTHMLSDEKGTVELLLCKKDNSLFHASATSHVVKSKSGQTIARVAIFKDINEHTRVKNDLLKSEQRWRSIAENPFDFVVIINRDYKYIYVNHTAPGITEESIIGKKTPLDFTDPEYHPKIITAFEAAFNDGKASYYDVYISQLDKWFSTFVGPIWENGQVTSVSLLTRDITLQKRGEEAYRQTEIKLRETHKLETVGTLAGGIAHDLNNILTPILAHGDLALKKIDANHPLYNSLQTINDATLRARDLVQRILLFSRRHDAQKTLLDLNELVSESVKLFRATIPSSISILVDVHTEPLWVYADRTQLNQIIANLVTNALQAMETSGNCLHLKVTPSKTQNILTDQVLMATIAVTDNGIGMDDETIRRAFDPFYTTKPVGVGTGLGLSIVYGIVQEHGGSVQIKSAPYQGTTISIQLPRDLPQNENHSLAPSTDSLKRDFTPVRILCIDDEPAILEVLKLVLSQNGHHVTTCNHAKDAQKLLAENAALFDLVITDQTMPYMMGTELIACLRKHSPDLPCLLMTGFDDEVTIKLARQVGVEEIILKPFSFPDLLNAIETAGVR